MKNREPIAVIGMGGVFPDAMNPKALWENVLKGRDSARDVPPGRWGVNPHRVHDKMPGHKIPGHKIPGGVDRVSTTRGCFIREPLPDPVGDLPYFTGLPGPSRSALPSSLNGGETGL